MPTVKDLAARVFLTRSLVHSGHFATERFATHIALNELYDAIVGDVDAVVEVYQGKFGLIGPIPALAGDATVGLISHLAAEAAWIEQNRDEIAQGTQCIANLIDELTATYYRQLYKLRHLG